MFVNLIVVICKLINIEMEIVLDCVLIFYSFGRFGIYLV